MTRELGETTTVQVFVVRLGSDIEEEVDVVIDGRALTCFMSVCPHEVEQGRTYRGSVSLWAADGLDLREALNEPVGMTRLGDGFRYRVVGILRGVELNAGIRFEDDAFASELHYLDGRLVAVDVDRIQLALE